MLRHVGGALLAVGHAKVVTLDVDTALAHITAERGAILLDPLAANVAKFSSKVTTVRPTMWDWVLFGGGGGRATMKVKKS